MQAHEGERRNQWQPHMHAKDNNGMKKRRDNSHRNSEKRCEAAGHARATTKEVEAARRQWRLKIIKFPTNNQQRACSCVCVTRSTCDSKVYMKLGENKQTEKTLLSACPPTGIFIEFPTHKHTHSNIRLLKCNPLHPLLPYVSVNIWEENSKYFQSGKCSKYTFPLLENYYVQ